MKVLVTFCETEYNGVQPNLLLLDVDSGEQRWIEIGVANEAVTGVACDSTYIYLLFQQEKGEAGIVLLDRQNFSVKHIQTLPLLKDPHSIVPWKNEIYLVSTGRNEVQVYRYENGEIHFNRVAWMPDGTNTTRDMHHLNGLYLYNECLYISGFGEKINETWLESNKGYVYNITESRKEISGIYHPHSVCVSGTDIYYCESFTKKVKCNDRDIYAFTEGYVRGLAIYQDYIVCGFSSVRKISKSTQKVNDLSKMSGLDPCCKVAVLRPIGGQYKVVSEFDYLPEKLEIYDVIPFE